MELLGKVRRMHYRDGLSRSEIARRTGLSRNTVKKWLTAPEAVEPRYRRLQAPGKLDPFHGALLQALEADARRPKRDRRTAKALYAELKSQGYAGGYTVLTDFIRHWREQAGANAPTRAFVPLRFELGEAFQFDWSEERLVIGGVWRKLLVAHLKLCASRAFVLIAYPSQSHEMLFDAHTRSFQALGGIPRRGIYDNMKTAVDKVKKGKGRVVNARFSALCSHYLFDPDFCNVASGWEKGVVEKNVQDSRRRIWLEAGTLRFGSFAELNAWLLARCQALWQEVRHPEYALSVAEMLEHEQPHLMPMVSAFDGYVEEPGRVSSTCLVTAARNHYSVPCELAGKLISKRFYPERIEVVFDEVVMASHPRLFERGQTRYDWRHYLPLVERKPGVLRNGAPFAEMPEPLVRLQRLLLRREGGDRVMSQMLAVVPKAGLDTVLVAVELVLESGVVSVEHVLNVIARLNQAPLPESVPTTLQVKEAPVADTGRYDRLRTQEADHA
ncbi:IS21 family transposase [Thauera aminoaromatica]|jgi:transposase|uniref:IS21 family transposase n=1 Tax=Thauera aminoaromatica TaxID=164330 RepID=A0A5C7S5G8_THASP|nr:IS21 family transposase [Thauera aminoaromatica]TXH79128.1 MAG: IS21 family transposase [Thauera aminoaromatica]